MISTSKTAKSKGSTLVNMDGKPIQAKAPKFDEENDVKEAVFKMLGDLDDIEITFNDVIVAKYIRANVSEHLMASAYTQLEDQWQGKCGLVLKLGPTAFQDDPAQNIKFSAKAKTIKPGDWVAYRYSDGWDTDIQIVGSYNAVKCRWLQDAHIRGIVKYPGRLF